MPARRGGGGPSWWPAREEARVLLARLGLVERDLAVVLRHYPEGPGRPPWWPLLLDARERLVDSFDRPGEVELLADGSADLGPVGPLFGIYVLFGALSDILGWHRDRGIPEEVSWATLQDLGRQVALYHRFHGETGFDEHGWVSRHFRGLVFQLGRLQFERSHVPPEWRAERELADAAGPAGGALGIHVPEAGPLSPERCDESLALAPAFFARHFPDEDYRVGICDSWLLDEQLSEYLPSESNIVRFQRRFQLLGEPSPNSRVVMRFIFDRHEVALDGLPQESTLQRAVVRHLRAGRDWCVRSGWLRLERHRTGELQPSGGDGPPAASGAV